MKGYYGNYGGYCYYASKASTHDNMMTGVYGIKCEPDDIVTIIVDLEIYQIRYKINDQDFGVAFAMLQKPYRIALYLRGEGSKVQIL